jgi:F0F1-type ATP synthase membrane subunit b/b'
MNWKKMTPEERAAFRKEAEAGIQRLRDRVEQLRAEIEAQRAREAERRPSFFRRLFAR